MKRKLSKKIDFVEDYRCKYLAKQYDIVGEFKRIYFYHIRKCGGTSLNQMFLSLSGQKGNELYRKLPHIRNNRIVFNKKVYVGWNQHLIEEGNYFYAFSHIPEHEFRLPKNTFTISCLRDPVKRILSHYKMLLEYERNKIQHPVMKNEGKWLGNNFSDFLTNIPQEHLLRQIYMFSGSFNVDEALDKILGCSCFLLVEDFSRGIEALSKKLDMELKPIHIRKTSIDLNLSTHDLAKLRECLDDEYRLLEKIEDSLH